MIDHINRIKLDNRIENLRPVDIFQSNSNTKRRADNTSGVKGIIRDKRNNVWVARIKHKNKQYQIGTFKKLDEAAAAIRNVREKLHGEFASHF